MKKRSMKPLLVVVGVLVGVPALLGLNVLKVRGDVASDLREKGYTDVKLKLNGLFSWGFEGTKGTSKCSGTIEKMPGSTTTSEFCADMSPPKTADVPPPRPQHEILQEGLRKELAPLHADGVKCDPIGPDDVKAHCSAWGRTGKPIDVSVAKKGDDWVIESPEKIVDRATLASEIVPELDAKTKAKMTIDCGEGLFGHKAGDTLTCSTVREGAKTPPGKLVVTFRDKGYEWSATGL